MNENTIKVGVLKDPHHFQSKQVRADFKEIDFLKVQKVNEVLKNESVSTLLMTGDVFNQLWLEQHSSFESKKSNEFTWL